jgi:hypothetical protein
VLVGPDEVAFTVHENFICAKSKFFQAAYRKEWSEGAQKLIRLPEVEPGVFRSYLNLVYTGDLAVDSTKDDPVNPKNTKYSNFLKLYVLGDTLDDLSLRNSTMEILVSSNYQLSPASITWAFEHTPTQSLLRKMLVRFAALRWDRAAFASDKAKYHPEFVQDLAEFLMMRNAITTAAAFVSFLPDFLEDKPGA